MRTVAEKNDRFWLLLKIPSSGGSWGESCPTKNNSAPRARAWSSEKIGYARLERFQSIRLRPRKTRAERAFHPGGAGLPRTLGRSRQFFTASLPGGNSAHMTFSSNVAPQRT